MPGYTGDVEELNSVDDLPKEGKSSVSYIIKGTCQMFRWVNGKYIEVIAITPSDNQPRDASLEILRLHREIADLKKSDSEAKAALGIVAAANRRVGYAAMILFVMWLNGFRYVETKWEMFFSLFGYTVYLSLIRTVDWFTGYGSGFVNALVGWLESASKQCL